MSMEESQASRSKITPLRPAGTAPPTERRPRHWGRRIVLGLILLTAVALTALWFGVQATARGIATGYLQAAGAAYQVGRPIPDTIFETGSFRVQAKSGRNELGNPTMTVAVRERWLNTTLFQTTKPLTGLSNR